MEYGKFIDGGKAYEITVPVTPSSWSNYLFNDEYHMELSQTLQGKSSTVSAYHREAFTLGYRYFYVLDHKTGKAFNPNYVPLRRRMQEYSCVHGLNETRLHSVCDDVQSDIKVMVPVSGCREFWTVKLKNRSGEKKELSLFSIVGFDDDAVMGGQCVCDKNEGFLYKYAFPYHVFYEDKEKAEKTPSHYYMFSDVPATSFEMSQRRFWGCDDIGEYPIALKNGKCSNILAEAEAYCGCLHHKFTVPAGEEVIVRIQIGLAAGVDEIRSLKRKWNAEALAAAEAESSAYWDNLCSSFLIETPDENVNHFANYWLKKQITLLTRQNRGDVYCPVRNQLQDALGYALVHPKQAKDFIYRVLSLQKQNGFIKQWYMTDGSPDKKLCLLRHTDGPLWLIIAVITLIRQNGDSAMFFDDVPYGDSGSGPVYEHLIKAAAHMYNHRGSHGLCLVGDGDWNDPINGLGRRGKGESVWSTLALIFCIDLLLTHMIDDTAAEIRPVFEAAHQELSDLVNIHCWIGDRYIVGYDDDGAALGSPEDNNRLFLNTQTWAIIAGVVSQQRMPVVLANLEKLETPFGPALLDRPFDDWDKRWGRISIKKSGTTENGSVYCHASMFKAYSDAVRCDGDAVYDTVRRTLPTNPDNPPEKNLQLPLYLSNYYYTLAGSANYGRSSCHYGTGTTAWMLLVILEELLGVKSSTKGLAIQPNLPADWSTVRCTRRFRDAVYRITIHSGKKKTIVNGQRWDREYLPYEAGKIYEVVAFR